MDGCPRDQRFYQWVKSGCIMVMPPLPIVRRVVGSTLSANRPRNSPFDGWGEGKVKVDGVLVVGFAMVHDPRNSCKNGCGYTA